jgi:hypothetical protein
MQNENVYTNDWTGPVLWLRACDRNLRDDRNPAAPEAGQHLLPHLHRQQAREHRVAAQGLRLGARSSCRQNSCCTPSTCQRIHRAHAGLAPGHRGPDGPRGWSCAAARTCAQWRVDASVPAPLVDAGAGLAGYQLHAGQRYLHATKSIATYAATTRAGGTFYLESANGRLLDWQRSGPEHRFRFSAHVPLQVRFFAPGCTHQAAAGQRSQLREDRLDIEADRLGPQTVVLRCAG